MPQLEFRNYRFLMNLLQGYEFFLVLFKNMEAELKKEVSQLNRGLKIVLSGMLKVQS